MADYFIQNRCDIDIKNPKKDLPSSSVLYEIQIKVSWILQVLLN